MSGGSMLDQWAKHSDERFAIEEFLDWANNKYGIFLASWGDTDTGYPIERYDIQDRLDEYHGIDRRRLEEERRELLEIARRASEGAK